MGKFELEMFDPPPDQEFICSICRCVMEDPQECPCGHVFCKDCIQQWLRSHSTCPNCRKHCHMIKPVLPMVRNLISHLTIRCENHQAGCEKRVQLEYYDNHKLTCDYASVPCPNEGCDTQVLRINMDDHRGVCDYHRETCLKGCGISILRKEQAGHSCILELKKKLEEQEQEKRSLQQQNAELQTRVDNLKFLCWRSRNYLKKNMNTETPGTLHNLCVDLENATGLAPDNTEGHRDAAIPQASRQLHWSESDSSDIENIPPETSPESSLFQPTAESTPYQPSPANSPPHTIDLPNEYQPSPANSPPRPIGSLESSPYQPSPSNSPPRPIGSLSLYHIDSPDEYQPSPANSPPRPIDSPDQYQPSPANSPPRPIGSLSLYRIDSPDEYQPSPANSPPHTIDSPNEYQPSPSNSPPRPIGSLSLYRIDSPDEYQPSPANSPSHHIPSDGEDENEEGGQGNTHSEAGIATNTAETNVEESNDGNADRGEAQPQERTRAEATEHRTQGSTQANSRDAENETLSEDEESTGTENETVSEDEESRGTESETFSEDEETTIESDSSSDEDSEAESSSDHTENLRYLLASDSDPTYDEDSPSESETAPTDQNINRRSTNVHVESGSSQQSSRHDWSETTAGTQRATASTSNSRRLSYGGGLSSHPDSPRIGTSKSKRLSFGGGLPLHPDSSRSGASNSRSRRLTHGGGLAVGLDSSRSGTVQNSTTSTQQNSQNSSERTADQKAPAASTSDTRMVRQRRGLHYEPDSPRSGTVQDSTTSTQQNSQNRSETALDQRAPISTSVTRMVRFRRGLHYEPDSPRSGTEQDSTAGSTQQNSQNRLERTADQRTPISTSNTRMLRLRRGLHYEPDSPRSGTEQDSTAGSTQQNSQNRLERTATDQRTPISTSNTRMLRHLRGLAFEPDPPSSATVQNSTTSTQQNSQSRSETTVESEQVRSRGENARPASDRAEDTVVVEDSEEVGDNADGSTPEAMESAVVGHSRSIIRVRGTPLVIRNSRNRQTGQRSRTNQVQGSTRNRGAPRPQGSARSQCSFARQRAAERRSQRNNATPPVITIGSSDGNQSSNQQRDDTEATRTQRELGVSQQQGGSAQQTQINRSSTREIVEIDISGAEEVTARESRRRRRVTVMMQIAAGARERSATAQRRVAPAQGRPPTAARSRRRLGANSMLLDSGESESEAAPTVPKRPRRHNGGKK
uniref:RING-type domain-containing protein n=1 Tax=Branchiostoma floridae TaxID=7739 RepID=C3Y9A7_BRAFL|eukprot:XP_002607153.1 hypothetical protein BRAFLDRAFT_118654 [Branchiostoma floridae]